MWNYSYYELIKKIELRSGEVQSSHMTFFTCMAEVVAGAFGGGSDTSNKANAGSHIEDLTTLDTNAYLARANQLMSGKF